MKKSAAIVRDEKAQAMTEFAIVIPVILFVVFMTFQLIMIWQSNMMTRFAAFSAARAAAVWDAHIGTAGAQQKAKCAAALALMPVSKPVNGELDFYAQRTGASGSAGIKSFLQNSAGFQLNLLNQLPAIYDGVIGGSQGDDKLAWLFVAWNRLYYDPSGPFQQAYGKQSVFASKLGTSKIAHKVAGELPDKIQEKMAGASELTEINLELKYSYPLMVPGFASLWDSLSSDKLNSEYAQISPSLMYYFYTELGKCSVGYETFYRNFESEGKTGNPYADQMKSVDPQRIAATEASIMALQTQLTQLQQAEQQCFADHPGTAGQAACQAQYDPQIKQVQKQLDALAQQMQDLGHL